MVKVRTIKRGKSKIWSYAFEIGRIDGKRKTVQKSGFKSEPEAYNAGVIAYDKYLHGGLITSDKKMYFSDFMDEWFENKCKLHLRPETATGYESYIRRHVKPYLGRYKLKEITPLIIDTWLEKLVSKLSVGLSRLIFDITKKALNYAVEPARLISSNPAHYAEFPKKRIVKKIKRVIIRHDDLDKVLANLPLHSTAYVPITISYYTGMRAGEVLGLTWDDVDLENRQITVNKQLKYIKYQGKYLNCIGPTKNDNSIRTVLIGDALVKYLKKWKATQAQNTLASGQDYVVNYGTRIKEIEENVCIVKAVPASAKSSVKNIYNFICTSNSGSVIARPTLFSIGRRMKKRGIDFNFHSLRHTQATLALEGGAPIKDIAARLGDTVNTIGKVYTHDTVQMQQQTVDIIERKAAGADK